jgi:hypothetical protein
MNNLERGKFYSAGAAIVPVACHDIANDDEDRLVPEAVRDKVRKGSTGATPTFAREVCPRLRWHEWARRVVGSIREDSVRCSSQTFNHNEKGWNES